MDHETLSPGFRSLVLMDETGDTTITWEEANDDEMLAIIERKMQAGVTFYLVPERKPGQRGRLAKEKAIKAPREGLEKRTLHIKDADFAKFVLEGKGVAVPSGALATEKTATGATKTVRRAKTPREVASGHSIGHAPRAGG